MSDHETSTNKTKAADMNDKNAPNEAHLKLYSLLVDQLQKYTTVVWQFPTALIAANFFALDKFLTQPKILIVLALLDSVLVYVFAKLVHHQSAIISASKKAEEILREELSDTKYQSFVPTFTDSGLKASTLTVWSLSFLTALLFIFAASSYSCSFVTHKGNQEYKSVTTENALIEQELNNQATNDWKLLALVQNQTGSNQFTLIFNRTNQR